MWTKREFPAERVDKRMENCLRQFATSLPTLIHPLTTFRRSRHEGISTCLRRNNNNFLT